MAKGRYSVGNAARSPRNRKRGSLDRNLDRTLRPFSIFDRKTINAVVLLGNLDIDNFAEARGRTLRRRGPSSRRSNSTAAKKESQFSLQNRTHTPRLQLEPQPSFPTPSEPSRSFFIYCEIFFGINAISIGTSTTFLRSFKTSRNHGGKESFGSFSYSFPRSLTVD